MGTSFLDEIVHPKHVSIYLAIFYMLAVIGPALGYALGGLFLSIYVDPWIDTHLKSSDPGWVGAWWMCFIFCSVTSFIIAVPFFFFPRHLPNREEICKLREEEMAKKSSAVRRTCDDTDDNKMDLGRVREVLKGFVLQLKGLFSNPSWLFISTAITVGYIVVSGFASFGPKYIESQFGLTSSSASLLIGLIGE